MNLFFLILLLSLFLVISPDIVHGFAAPTKKKSAPGPKELPRYDGKTQKWIPTGPNQLPEAGYPPIKSLLLQGPQPFITRIFQPDDYEQAVLKFMAGDKLTSRDQAQGNMDAYLRNPSDWMFTRMESQKKGIEYDYTVLSVKDIALTVVWGSFVFLVIGRVVYSITTGTDFYAFGPFSGSY